MESAVCRDNYLPITVLSVIRYPGGWGAWRTCGHVLSHIHITTPPTRTHLAILPPIGDSCCCAPALEAAAAAAPFRLELAAGEVVPPASPSSASANSPRCRSASRRATSGQLRTRLMSSGKSAGAELEGGSWVAATAPCSISDRGRAGGTHTGGPASRKRAVQQEKRPRHSTTCASAHRDK